MEIVSRWKHPIPEGGFAQEGHPAIKVLPTRGTCTNIPMSVSQLFNLTSPAKLGIPGAVKSLVRLYSWDGVSLKTPNPRGWVLRKDILLWNILLQEEHVTLSPCLSAVRTSFQGETGLNPGALKSGCVLYSWLPKSVRDSGPTHASVEKLTLNNDDDDGCPDS